MGSEKQGGTSPGAPEKHGNEEIQEAEGPSKKSDILAWAHSAKTPKTVCALADGSEACDWVMEAV